jgi:4-amino-4-deoxy-L-arabinose transferase-like glycosyltransferase
LAESALTEPSLQLALRAVWQDRFCRTLLISGVALHLLLAFSFHLSPDETHYALYSVNPAWSYFDHPPMSGWLQWPFSHLPLVGASDVAMRILPMLCWLLAAWLLPAFTFVLHGATMAPTAADVPLMRGALLLWCLAPMAHLLGLALVPDTLLMPLVLVVMLLTWRLCDPARVNHWQRWVFLGVALGLSGLTKYTAIFIALGAALALLLAHGGRVLVLPGAWLGIAVAGLMITPVIAWNATHEWISLAYQSGHAAGSQEWLLSRVVVYKLVQVLGYGALLSVGVVACVVMRRTVLAATASSAADSGAARALGTLSPLALCLCFGVPPLLLLVFLSGRGSTLPHWSISAWLALTPVAAAGCLALWQRRSPVARRSLAGLGGFQALCVAGMLALMLASGVQREADEEANTLPGKVPATASFNPFTDLYGWDAAAARARTLAQNYGNPTLAVMNWTLASRIAWYARAPTKVVQRHLDQFGLWWGVLQPGENALVVDWSQMSFAPPVGGNEFERCDLIEQQPVMRLGRQVAHFNFQLCNNWQGPKESALDRRK